MKKQNGGKTNQKFHKEYCSTEEAENTMNLSIKMTRIFGKGLAALVLLTGLILYALPAAAACPGVDGADTDGDGIFDTEECGSFTLPGPDGGTYITDPDVPDLFVILVKPAEGSQLPENPFEMVTKPKDEGGLGIVVHEITDEQADEYGRIIVRTSAPFFQKAIKVIESLNTSISILGSTEWGTPNDPAESTTYTAKVIQEVNEVCGSSPCTDNNGNSGDALRDVYIKHTLAHEMAHKMKLAPDLNTRFGGYHDKSGTGYLMDQSLIYKVNRKTGDITYYMTTDYSPPHQEEKVLK